MESTCSACRTSHGTLMAKEHPWLQTVGFERSRVQLEVFTESHRGLRDVFSRKGLKGGNGP